MKAQKLAELLMEYPDYDVEFSYSDTSNCTAEYPWSNYHVLVPNGELDVYSIEKTIELNCEEI